MKLNKQLTKIIEWLVYASVVLVPIIFMPQVNSVFAAPKLYVFRVITLLIILLWGLKCLFDDKLRVRFSKFFWFVIAYGIVSIINTFVTVNIYTSLFGTYGRFLGIFTVINLLFWIYIVFSFINTREKIVKLMWVSVCTAFTVAVYGLLQYFDVFVNFIPWTMDPQERLFATIGHSNHTAAYLGMNLMLLLGLIFNNKNKKLKIALWIGFAIIALTLILTASRGGVFAVIIAGIFWLVFILKQKKLKKKAYKYTIIALILAGIMGMLLSGPISRLGVVERTTSTITFVMQGNMPDRISWWLSSFEMIADKPFLGHGLSGFKDVYNQYRRIDYKAPNNIQDNITPETAHNEYLNIAATQGIIGFLIYAAMIVMLFVYAFKYFKKAEQQDKIYEYGLITAAIVYLIQVSISFGTIVTLFLFFTIAGSLISYTLQDQKAKSIKSNIYLKLIIIIAALIVSIGLSIFSFNSLRADYHFKQAAHFASQAELKKTIENFEVAQKLMPYIPEYFEGHADFLFEFAIRLPEEMQETFLIDAAKKYEEANILISGYPSILANMALVHSKLADLYKNNELQRNQHEARAKGFMLHANELSKNNPLYKYKTAQMFEFFDEYGSAYDYYIDVLKIRDPYKDTAEKIQLMRELEPKIAEGEANKALENAEEDNVIHFDENSELLPGEYTAD
jgi:O-antigen ligase